jgi:RNA-binding protein NOB1
MKLLALAHTLEVAAHGSAHLRTHAAAPKMAPKHKTRTRGLPGWGNVPNPEDWAVVDAVPDNEHSGTVSGSRIAQQAQELELDGGLVGSGDAEGTEQQDEDESEGEAGEEDGGGWETAARTSNARRRKWVALRRAAAGVPALPAAGACGGWAPQRALRRGGLAADPPRRLTRRLPRRQRREIRWQMRMQEEAEALAALQISQQRQQRQQQQQAPAADSSSSAAAADSTAAAAGGGSGQQPGGQQQQQEQKEGQQEGQQQQREGQQEGSEEGSEEYTDEGEEEEEEESDEGSEGGLSSVGQAFQSSIASVTADFAMQNVLLQMGLRLVSR